ncbi:MAG: hypothetical protein C5B57_05960 [Blastocatellia bacterium]|nr:MAG: hypothetical protein C5B57_05960 [Blastocatellia bacterium]
MIGNACSKGFRREQRGSTLLFVDNPGKGPAYDRIRLLWEVLGSTVLGFWGLLGFWVLSSDPRFWVGGRVEFFTRPFESPRKPLRATAPREPCLFS